ncbi:MAG: prohibitin family protein [Candidatus Bathyarchaeia archaeon]|jgi:regulator of protease activity HflC (stomatin/prohibitin superfamily)
MEGFFKKILALIIIVMLALVTVGILVSAYQTVPTGYQGVVLQWGNPVRSVSSGLNLITPIAEDIALVNIQVQKTTAQESAASSDLQEVSTSVTVNYQLDANYARDIYTNLRDQYESRVILPAMQDALKAATAKFQASELITQREAAKNLFLNLLQEKLDQYHIKVVSVSITDFQFSESFKMAIEAKVTAEQNALAAKNKLEQIGYEAQQQVIQATANSTAIITIAQANANATIISANATAQAVEIIQAQLTPEYIQYLYAIGWDGKLPIYWSSGNSTAPFLLLPVDQTTNSTAP